MKYYTFDKTDSGAIGKAFEMAIKDALRRKNADRVSPCGSSDFTYNRHHYEVKQNGGVMRYADTSTDFKGSKRIIYATHVAYEVVELTADKIAVAVDLANTDLLVVERSAFVEFLKSINCVKVNESRGTVNIQTVYNYTKNAYHGRKGYAIEEWAAENEQDDDDIIGAILEGVGL